MAQKINALLVGLTAALISSSAFAAGEFKTFNQEQKQAHQEHMQSVQTQRDSIQTDRQSLKSTVESAKSDMKLTEEERAAMRSGKMDLKDKQKELAKGNHAFHQEMMQNRTEFRDSMKK